MQAGRGAVVVVVVFTTEITESTENGEKRHKEKAKKRKEETQYLVFSVFSVLSVVQDDFAADSSRAPRPIGGRNLADGAQEFHLFITVVRLACPHGVQAGRTAARGSTRTSRTGPVGLRRGRREPRDKETATAKKDFTTESTENTERGRETWRRRETRGKRERQEERALSFISISSFSVLFVFSAAGRGNARSWNRCRAVSRGPSTARTASGPLAPR
jgi:hypothetical protein